MKIFLLSLKMLRRNWRAGEARVLIAALFVAVASVTTVGFFADRVEGALNRQANELIASDAVVITDKPTRAAFRERAQTLGLTIAQTVTFPSMVAGDADKGQGVNLAEIKAVSDNFPLRGKMRVTDTLGAPDREADGVPKVGTVWVPDTLLARINIGVGDMLKVGDSQLQIAGVITKEPDSVLDYFGVMPRVLLNDADLKATGLVQVGSRVTYRMLLAGDTLAIDTFKKDFAPTMQRGERIETVRDSRSEVRTALDRAQRFLGLATLLSVILAAVAVALAARRFSQRQVDSAAMMRCLGASQADIFGLNFYQFMAFGLIAVIAGSVFGYIAQAVLAALLTQYFTVVLPQPSATPALQGALIGATLLFGFTLPPLLALRKVSTLRVLRRDVNPLDAMASSAYILGFFTLLALIVWQAGNVKLGLIAAAGFVIILAIAGGAGWLLINLAGRGRIAASGAWRYGIANMKRRSNSSLIQIIALGLGIMALLLLTLVRSDLIGAWQTKLKDGTANRFVINIQNDQVAKVAQFYRENKLETSAENSLSPMIRGRLVEINDEKIAPSKYKDDRARRLVEREFNLSWSQKLPDANRVVSGSFWTAENAAEPAYSIEEGIAKTLGISVGDTLTYDVAGTKYRAKVTNLRAVTWDNFKPNFFVLANPALMKDLPASYISSFYLAPGSEGTINKLIAQFPNLTVIDLTAIMTQVRAISDQVGNAVSFVFLFTLAAGLVVLYAAIASTQDERVFDAAIMRTLGANRRQLMILQLAEFLAIGLLAGAVASAGALGLASVLSEQVFNVPYKINALIPLIGLIGGGLGVAMAGLIGTRHALNTPPIAVIRSLA